MPAAYGELGEIEPLILKHETTLAGGEQYTGARIVPSRRILPPITETQPVASRSTDDLLGELEALREKERRLRGADP
jgi:hypothetical protein